MRLTKAEAAMLRFLTTRLGRVTFYEWLSPSQRAMVKRMRAKGLLSKREPQWVRMTELGRTAS